MNSKRSAAFDFDGLHFRRSTHIVGLQYSKEIDCVSSDHVNIDINCVRLFVLRLESSFAEIALENWIKRYSIVRIFVRTSANTYTIQMKLSRTVEMIKEKIQAREGLPPDLLRLYYEGQLLEDGRSLLHYNIQNGSTLDLYMRLCGC